MSVLGLDLLMVSAEELGVTINDMQADEFFIFMEALIEWNKKFNLTSITSEKDIIIKHFVDSLSVLTAVDKYAAITENMLDIGTGAGFPGIPCKIARASIPITLMDSLKKRVLFLNYIVEKLKLKDTNCIHSRAEDAANMSEHRGKYGVCLSRAVAALNILTEYSLPFVKTGGIFIAQKGTDINDEIILAKKAIKTMGGELTDILEIKLPHSDIVHKLVVISKLYDTPAKYPRKPNIIKKSPII